MQIHRPHSVVLTANCSRNRAEKAKKWRRRQEQDSISPRPEEQRGKHADIEGEVVHDTAEVAPTAERRRAKSANPYPVTHLVRGRLDLPRDVFAAAREDFDRITFGREV